jgi:hypothetical protein
MPTSLFQKSERNIKAFLNGRHVQKEDRHLTRLKQQATESDETILRLQQEIAVLDPHRDDISGATTRYMLHVDTLRPLVSSYWLGLNLLRGAGFLLRS